MLAALLGKVWGGITFQLNLLQAKYFSNRKLFTVDFFSRIKFQYFNNFTILKLKIPLFTRPPSLTGFERDDKRIYKEMVLVRLIYAGHRMAYKNNKM